MKRLLLLRHAPTAATRRSLFPLDDGLDARGAREAAGLAGLLPAGYEVVSSPLARCVETARAAGLEARTDPRLAECDFGRWAGRSLKDVHDEDPDGSAAWMTDPEAAPHEGESLQRLADRVEEWLGEQSAGDGRTLAVTHAGVIRVAVTRVLGAPLATFWRIDARPLSVTELHAADGAWRLVRLNCPVGAAS